MTCVKKSFPRSVASLDEIFSFVRDFCSGNRINERQQFPLEFVLEELFTNAVKYNPGGPASVEINLEYNDRTIIMRLIDNQIEPFDPRSVPTVDTEQSIGSRKEGGLGIFLTQKLIDDMSYEFIDGKSIIKLTKKITE